MKHKLPFVATWVALIAMPAFAALDTNRIEQVTGLKGSWNAAEGVFRISVPRTNLAVPV